MNKQYRKIVTFVIIAVMIVSGVCNNTVYAFENATNNEISLVSPNSEAAQEEIEEALSPNTGYEWFVAHNDGFYWGEFHKRVQENIREQNANMGTGELHVKYGSKNLEKLQGKYGFIDLYMTDDQNTYIWEVKPSSYARDPKRKKAKEQLEQYRLSNENKFLIGGTNFFSDGEFYVEKYNPKMRMTEHVVYKVDYWHAGEGLILYKFQCVLREYLFDPSPAAAISMKKARKDAVDETNNMPYETKDTDEDSEDSENSDWGEAAIRQYYKLMKLYRYANIMLAWAEQTMKNPDFQLSITPELVTACTAYISCINANVKGGEILNRDEVYLAAYDFETVFMACEGMSLIEYAEEKGYEPDIENIAELIKCIQCLFPLYNQAATTNPPIDPLIIDLGEPGIKLCTMENGVNFDLDNNGYAEKTAWTGTEDGFLALDRDGNGKIENGGELFGDRVTLKDGTTSASGFEALAELDTNGDGKIDASDADFQKLLVWTDTNHNGISEADELKSLSAHGIISISLSHRETSITDEETGVLNAETADVTISINGTEKITEISEFWFPVNTSDTTHVGIVTAGNIPDIESALANDTTGELAKWVYMFTESHDYVWKRYYLRQILYILADAQEIDPTSRGGNIDARNLKVIEKFMGRDFNGVGGENPNASAASILNEIYCDIETNYYNILNLYGELGGYLTLSYEYEDENGNAAVDLSLVYYVLNAKLSIGENIDYLVYDLGLYLKTYDEINGTGYFDEYAEYFEGISSQYEGIISRIQTETVYIVTDENDIYIATGANEIIFGGAGNDEIHGNDGNDTLYGEEGNDNLIGGEGNDILCGGEGNDALSGGYGNDSYLFNTGDGEDTIHDNYTYADGGEDKIIFGEGISPDMIEMWTEEADLVITYGEGDRITVDDAYWYSGGINMIESIVFYDGTVWMLEDIAARASVRYGSDGDDTIIGFDSMPGYSCDEIFYGGSGNDRIYGYAGNDTIYGQEGDDELYGGDGNGTFVGGPGNDTLNGGMGNDIYIFYVGDGNDIIYDGYSYENAGEDKIIFGEGISPDMIEMWTEGADLVITYGEGDRITVVDAYRYSGGINMIEYMEFFDGLVYAIDYENLILQLLTGE